MKKLLFLLLMMCLSFSLMVAAEIDFTTVLNKASTDLKGQELPGAVGRFFGNVQVNVYLKTNSGDNVIFGIVTKEKKFQSLQMEELKDPSLKIYTTEQVLLDIYSSPQPLVVLQNALAEKKITYQAVGFKNKIRFAFLSAFVGFKKTEIPANPISTENKLIEIAPVEDPEQASSISNKADQKKEIKIEKKVNEKIDKITEEKNNPEKVSHSIHTVEMTSEGFSMPELTIKAGDTVTWKNVRSGAINKAMIIGSRQCIYLKSKMFNSGESFSWTFNKPDSCIIVDGIMTTKTMTVNVNQ